MLLLVRSGGGMGIGKEGMEMGKEIGATAPAAFPLIIGIQNEIVSVPVTAVEIII